MSNRKNPSTGDPIVDLVRRIRQLESRVARLEASRKDSDE